MTGVGLAPCRPVGAKDVGDTRALDPGAAARGSGQAGRDRLREIDAEPIQRALDVADRGDGDAGVERRRLELGVSEQGHAIMSIFLCY